jgi:NhaP-type Na+/H+ or K+/H+ antiporter
VLALAAAMSLPQTVADGSPFPHRDLIVFLTFSVILVTLVIQGLTLPPLIRALGLAGSSGPKCEGREARRLVLEKTLKRLAEIRRNQPPNSTKLFDDLARQYRHRLASVSGDARDEDKVHAEHYLQYMDLSRELLAFERQAALGLRDEGRITDEILREMENELDLSETRLISATAYQTGQASAN